MNIHEYQAKELYRQYGVPTSTGYPAFSVEEAVEAAKKLPGPVWVVKAQIHAGGRGKGKFKEPAAGDKGGVRIAKSIEEVRTFAQQMLSHTLVTIQTGEAGRLVRRLYVEEGIPTIVLPREHAPELEVLDLLLERLDIGRERIESGGIVFELDQLQQLSGIGQAAVQDFDGVDHQLECGALAAEFLGPLRLLPDTGLAQLELDFRQAVFLDRVVKDTP